MPQPQGLKPARVKDSSLLEVVTLASTRRAAPLLLLRATSGPTGWRISRGRQPLLPKLEDSMTITGRIETFRCSL
jgi:hypothetical protein